MVKSVAFLIIIAARLVYQPVATNEQNAPFASHRPLPAATISHPAKLISFNGVIRNNKVILDWTVGDNKTASLFEVERSEDGTNFKTAALVFGNDIPYTGNYQFYEKAGAEKLMYRIKLVNKDRSAGYSPVIEIKPGV